MSRGRLAVSLAMMLTILTWAAQVSGWSFPLQAAVPTTEAEDLAEKGNAFADAWARANKLHPVTDKRFKGIPPPKRVEGVTRPRIIHMVEPEYTEEARATRLEGEVLLYVDIGPDGQAHNIRVVTGLGLGLDEKAIAAMQQWRFRPGELNGKPLTVGAAIVMVFTAPRVIR